MFGVYELVKQQVAVLKVGMAAVCWLVYIMHGNRCLACMS
jgi:hypothetical protein